ncbi:DoxX family protein [Gramella jeungdoensis]|uniref:DoxX family protein n=1 Tax=Gramella jeungdoensis TaxID=708091 RepID=A0ABT0Z3M2_9FLAO|nr:DoxX family protein [Gramella jeungdoensis]MCM8570336.1 DoxX family protein [Gramella jeungdoensis]
MRNVNVGLLILRISLGVLMLFHGIAKLITGVAGIAGMIDDYGPTFLAYGVYIGEIIAPIFLILGFRTRLAGLVYVATMLVAVLIAHLGDITSLSKAGGWAIELPALYFFGGLALFFTGGGKLAVSRKNKWD